MKTSHLSHSYSTKSSHVTQSLLAARKTRRNKWLDDPVLLTPGTEAKQLCVVERESGYSDGFGRDLKLLEAVESPGISFS